MITPGTIYRAKAPKWFARDVELSDPFALQPCETIIFVEEIIVPDRVTWIFIHGNGFCFEGINSYGITTAAYRWFSDYVLSTLEEL